MSIALKEPQDSFWGASQEKVALVKRTVAKNATDDELQLFIYVCKKTGLDPFMKQIYSVKRGTNMTIQTSIDGLRLIADRTGNYAPGKEYSFSYNEGGEIVSATAHLKKRTPDGTWHDVSATAFYKEYKPKFHNNFWSDMPHVMLGKCAESIALRKAFPAEMASVYSSEEMTQAEVSETPSSQLMSAQQVSVLEGFIGDNVELRNRVLRSYKVEKIQDIDSRHYEIIFKSLKRIAEDAKHSETGA